MKNKLSLITITVFIIVALYAIYAVTNSADTAQAAISSYSAQDAEKPQVEAKETFKDIGTIKLSEDSVTTFTIQNTGSKPLQLFNISSSCGCTVGQIMYNGIVSKEYGMHSKKSEVIELAPNTHATVKVIYRPYVMPVYGAVDREVYIETNDPTNQKLAFKIKTVVEK